MSLGKSYLLPMLEVQMVEMMRMIASRDQQMRRG